MLNKLLLKKKVSIIDGDNRLDACTGEIKTRLQSLLDEGLEVRGIQIFHYAGIHYSSRWNNYCLRFLNALLNSASSISSSKGSDFSLNDDEECELQRDSSEVLAVGLSNLFMCKWYGININRIEKIDESGKRCDYRFNYNNQIIVFESKGRSNSSQIKSALKDCIEKKKTILVISSILIYGIYLEMGLLCL